MTWNKVTPFSKIVALVIFIALPFAGFWLGIQYGQAIQLAKETPGQIGGSPLGGAYYSDTAAWPIHPRDDAGYSIAYPLDFRGNDIYPVGPTENWREGAQPGERGSMLLEIEIPASLEPQTNLVDSRLHVAYGTNGAAVLNCLNPDPTGERQVASSSVMVGGASFTKFSSADAALGNLYETTSYRTVRGGKCWTIEYTLHSSQIANYPASYGLHEFDKSYVTAILDRIIKTFRFTK